MPKDKEQKKIQFKITEVTWIYKINISLNTTILHHLNYVYQYNYKWNTLAKPLQVVCGTPWFNRPQFCSDTFLVHLLIK